MNDNVQQRLAKGPITGFQLGAIAVCVGLNMLDGFDVLAMAFSASGVKAAWALSDGRLGWLLSAGLIGMAVGALALAPCADFVGRRRIVLIAASVAALGMLSSVWARDFTDLLTLRVVTGIGIGGTIASAAVVVSEYASDRWRTTALAAYSTGYPVGATLGGVLTAHFMPEYGWRSAFAIGGVMSLLMALIALWGLPESLDFLITRRPPGALTRLNALLARMGQRALSALPEAPRAGAGQRVPLELLLTPRTLLVWLLFFCTMAAFYFSVSWTPRLLNAAGASAALGLAAGVLFNLGGIAGCGGFTLAAVRFDAHRLLLGSLIASALLVAAFGVAVHHVGAALWTALLLGLITNAAMSGLYAVGPPLYPAAVRASGMGWAVGIGRLGAILAPIVTGTLLDAGWAPANLYFLFAVPLVVAAIALLGIGLRQGS
ncbi:MAG TPA: MFS transporter [Steroidobacteraceae bacterium]|nr:MFS transporter [Steroidobacteraceae bacterium]